MRPRSVIAAVLVAGISAACRPAQVPANAGRPAPLLHFARIGSGPPLLLIHGFGGCGAVWNPLDSTLATKYQLIIPDLPGHGSSPRPAGGYTTHLAADEMIRLLDSLQVTRVRAIGASAGAIALLHAAVQRPELFDRIIIVSGGNTIPPEGRAVVHAMTSLDRFPPEVAAGWRGCAQDRGEQLDWLLAQFQRLGDDSAGVTLGVPDLQRITARTLIVHGENDPFFPIAIPTTLHQAIPRSSLWIIPGGEHVPIYHERMRPFLDTAMAFLARD